LFENYSQNILYNLASVVAGNELSMSLQEIETLLFLLLSIRLKNEAEDLKQNEKDNNNNVRQVYLGKAFEAVTARLSKKL